MRSSFPVLIMLLLLLNHIIFVPSFISVFANAQSFSLYSPPTYEDCAPLNCGKSIIRYPFGRCGLLNASCEANRTVSLSYSHTFVGRVVAEITEAPYQNASLYISQYNISYFSGSYDWLTDQRSFFNLSENYTMGTIINCSQSSIGTNSTFRNPFDLFSILDVHNYFFYSKNCTSYSIVVPNNFNYSISDDQNFTQLRQIQFQITWSKPYQCISCETTGGCCFGEFYCVCPDQSIHLRNCSDGNAVYSIPRQSVNCVKLAVIFSPVCTVVLFSIAVISYIVVGRKRSAKRSASDEEQMTRAFMDPLDTRPPSLENFLHYYKSQVPKRYSYSQIRAYTNNLADKIGKGGFGTVYKGKLPSGSLIAVKILDESKQSEHQFIAEVATVGRTYHVNLVRLLGYCSHRSKRALVYEYMENGSLDKYVHGGHEDELDWKQLHSIAVGTARGIAYLHEECRNHILHCDIKPHNVLLDANFLPKVADFGLAKISEREKSHISVLNRGTLGYAAPEMWSRKDGPVTDRSDVYSYGILIMEMVGGRKNIDFGNKERSSQFFYTEWAFKQVEKGEFGNLRNGNLSEEDQVIAKQLSLVGLWCIQFNASSRPPMSKVVKMLEGDIDITPPPFPFRVDAPPRRSASGESSSTSAFEIQMQS